MHFTFAHFYVVLSHSEINLDEINQMIEKEKEKMFININNHAYIYILIPAICVYTHILLHLQIAKYFQKKSKISGYSSLHRLL